MKKIIFFTPDRAESRQRRSELWPPEKDEILIKLYPDTLNTEIAKKLKVNPNQVAHRAFRLKLHKTREFMMLHAAKSFFKKGSVPHNKGKDCKHYQTDRSRATQFKKGGEPANTLHDGAITIRPNKKGVLYRFIRVAAGKWIYYARWLWEQHHGPVPKGFCVWHTDKDQLNDDISNLELITQRENRIRNSGSINLTDEYVATTIYTKKHPELKEAVLANKDLIEVKRLQIQLNRTIKSTSHDNSSPSDLRNEA